MNRIEEKFKQLKKENKKALILYLTAGYPSLAATEKLVPELEEAGADIIDVGVPFSDPVADGVTIQRTSAEALASYHVIVGLGMDPADILTEVPFHTVLLEWEGLACPMTIEDAEVSSRALLNRISGLMEVLHGEDAS